MSLTPHDNTKQIQQRFSSIAARHGPGGRESDAGIKACVFGSSGFLGRYVVASLAQIGAQVNIPHRGDEMDVRHLNLTGDLGRVINYPFSPRHEGSIKGHGGCDVVINLIKRITTRNTFYRGG